MKSFFACKQKSQNETHECKKKIILFISARSLALILKIIMPEQGLKEARVGLSNV
jgi:hypothetical protein